MNIKRAKEEIQNTIEAYLMKNELNEYVIPAIRQRPVLLIGPPGVGKTQIMEQIARTCKIGLVSYTITHHTRQSAIGLPFISKKEYDGEEVSVTEYTMSEIVASIYEKMEATGLTEGILFIDEINCVSETLAPTMLQFLQCKTFGNHRIPDGWIITAAGNPPEFNKSVREFDIVTLDRIKMITVEADFDVWKEYAYQEGIHGAVISYLNAKRQHFSQIETTVDGKRFATPRGWEDLSRLIEVYETMGKVVDRDVIAQYIQFPKISKDFANYLELYYKYQDDYQVDEILKGVRSEAMCNQISKSAFDEKLSVIGLLLSKLSYGFKEVFFKEEVINGIFEALVSVKEELLHCNAYDELLSIMSQMVNGYILDGIHKKKSGLLNRRQEHVRLLVAKELENYLQTLKSMHMEQGQILWEQLKSQFTRQKKSYEEVCALWGEKLEYAFDFMEASFGDSQESVIFVTELNKNGYSVAFLQQYECERYFQYNKRLLFSKEEQKMTQKIEQLGF